MRNVWIKLLAPVLLFAATTAASEPPVATPPRPSATAIMEGNLAGAKQRLNKLLQTHGNDHPDVKELRGLITLLERQLKEQKDSSSKPAAKDQQAPAKSKLEEMLEIALRSNPDIRVAEAKAHEADAELNRARLAVTQKVVQLYNSIEAARAKVESSQATVQKGEADVKRWQAEVERFGKLAEKGIIGQANRDEVMAQLNAAKAQVDQAKAQLVQAKADLSKLEAEVPYLQGQPKGTGSFNFDPFRGMMGSEGNNKTAQDAAIRLAAANVRKAEADMQRWQPELTRAEKLLKEGIYDEGSLACVRAQLRTCEANLDAAKAQYDLARAYASPKTGAAITGAISDKLRAALDKPMSADFVDNNTLIKMLMYIHKNNPDLFINNKGMLVEQRLTPVRFKDLPLGAVFQWLEDELPEYRIVVREYGLLLAPRDKLPPDAVLLHDFWKAKPKEEKK